MKEYFEKYIKHITRSIRTRYLKFKDATEVFFGYRHVLVPPKRYDNINIGDHEKIGEEFLGVFVQQGGLRPTDRVLEVGSGFGRMAISLTKFLTQEGRYVGLDIIKDGINWCQSNFTPRYPNFKFQLIDVYNKRYNPLGSTTATTYTFPFEDDSFDFVYLTSVFTHMYPNEIENYLNEISRVLKQEGKCFITYYLLNEISLNNINQNKGTYNFNFEVEEFRIEDKANPLYQIAFKEAFIRKLYVNSGISIIEPIHYGNWSGRRDFLSFQDIVIGAKI